MAIFLGMGAGYVCAGAGGGTGGAAGSAGSGMAPATLPGQQRPPVSPTPTGNGMMPGMTNGMTPGMTNGTMPQNGMGTPGANMTGATNGAIAESNYFRPSGTRGYYSLGTNGGFLRGTNGFYRRGMNGSPAEFVPDGSDLYERGPDGLYHRDDQDDSRGVYRNGVLYSPTNEVAPTNGVQMNQ